MRNIFIASLFVLSFIGCAGNKIVKAPSNASKADIMLARGKEYFDSGKWGKAIDVLSKYVYSYSYDENIAEGTFLLAESYFKDGQFDLAAGEYRRVAQRFEDSEYAEKAELMIAESFLAASPRTDLDQEKTRAALDYFTDFITYHPESEYLEQARDGISRCREKLAEKEYKIALVYFKLKKAESVALYADLIAEEYGGTSWVPEAMLLKGRAYSDTLPDSAKKIFADLIANYPDTKIAEKAAKYRSKLED